MSRVSKRDLWRIQGLADVCWHQHKMRLLQRDGKLHPLHMSGISSHNSWFRPIRRVSGDEYQRPSHGQQLEMFREAAE